MPIFPLHDVVAWSSRAIPWIPKFCTSAVSETMDKGKGARDSADPNVRSGTGCETRLGSRRKSGPKHSGLKLFSAALLIFWHYVIYNGVMSSSAMGTPGIRALHYSVLFRDPCSSLQTSKASFSQHSAPHPLLSLLQTIAFGPTSRSQPLINRPVSPRTPQTINNNVFSCFC